MPCHRLRGLVLAVLMSPIGGGCDETSFDDRPLHDAGVHESPPTPPEGPWGPETCFAAGTMIMMWGAVAAKPIEEVVVGDRVATVDPILGLTTPGFVEQTFEHEAAYGELRLVLTGNTSVSTILRVTPEHPVCANGQYVAAGTIRTGDLLLSSNFSTYRALDSLSELQPATVYNLTVSDNHNYFAGGVLVHNKSYAIREDVPFCFPADDNDGGVEHWADQDAGR